MKFFKLRFPAASAPQRTISGRPGGGSRGGQGEANASLRCTFLPHSAVDRLLFVYGTLRGRAGHKMARWLQRHARHCGAARFQGRLYDLGGYPGAVASSESGEWVIGELYRLHRRAHLGPLDRYEGCGRQGIPPEYHRRRVLVLRGGHPLEAWIYLYALPVRFKRRIRVGDWFRGG